MKVRRQRALLGTAAIAAGLAAIPAGAAAAPAPEPPTRLVGLERLYFEPLADPGAVDPVCAEMLRELLPPALPAPNKPTADSGGPCDLMAVRELDLEGALLRQVIDFNHPRIAEQYWGLYVDGRRRELWYFAPYPNRTGDKLLAPLEVVEAVAPGPRELVLRVQGAMVRPQGAWWIDGSDLIFERAGSELRYRRLVRRFGFGRGYDLGGPPPPITVLAERIEPGGAALIVSRYVDPPADLRVRCGWTTDPAEGPDGGFEELAALAACVTADPGAERTRRELDAPSFLERGGAPPFAPPAAPPDPPLPASAPPAASR